MIWSALKWVGYSVKNSIVRPKVLCSFLLLLASLLTCGIFIVKTYADEDEEDARNNAIVVANEVGSWFSTELDKALLPLFTVAQFVQELEIFHDLPAIVKTAPNQVGRDCEICFKNVTSVVDQSVFDKFDEISERIKRDAKMEKVLVNVQIAPDAVVTALYPLINSEDFEPPTVMDNTGAQGHDLLNDPKRVAIARATVPADDVVMAGPLKLVQGGVPVVEECMIARMPIKNIGNNTITIDGIEYQCWGFAVILLNWAALKEKSGIYQRFQRENMEFNMTRTDKIIADGIEFEKVNLLIVIENFGFNFILL